VTVAAVTSALLDLLYPPRCAACGAGGAWLCATCRVAIHPIQPPYCVRCGQPLDDAACRSCVVATPAPSAIRAAALFRGPVRDVIHALKYRNLTAVAPTLAMLMRAAYDEAGWSTQLVAPVPLHPARERQRGYNQAVALAKPLAAALGIPCVPRVLRRDRVTADQIGLDVQRRRANVADAFSVPAPGKVQGRSVLLVDDVATTGCTLDACALALQRAGATSVYALVVARRALGDDGHV